MDKTAVAIARCRTYDPDEVGAAIDVLIEALGGFEKYLKPGAHVFLKPNLLLSAAPEKAVCTHPEVMAQLIKKLQSFGARVSFGDLPGGFHVVNTKKVHRATGMEAVAERTGAELVVIEQHGFREVDIHDHVVLGHVHIPKYLDDVDAIINVCKIKTHMQARYTGAVKNMFGLVTTQDRLRAHKHAKYEEFAEALVDIFSVLKPTLNFADAVVGMEGTGPSQGSPVALEYLAASADAVALDTVCVRLMGFKPGEIGTITAGRRRGLGEGHPGNIALKGGTIEDFAKEVKRPAGAVSLLIPLLSSPMSEWMAVRPVIKKSKCKKCRTCVEVCPNDAVRTSGKHFEIDDGRCLKCFCCHEMCPHDAVGLHKPLLVRIAELVK